MNDEMNQYFDAAGNPRILTDAERDYEDMRRFQSAFIEADQERIYLRRLCAHAADALEKYTNYPIDMVMSVTLRESGRAIAKELRKATK